MLEECISTLPPERTTPIVPVGPLNRKTGTIGVVRSARPVVRWWQCRDAPGTMQAHSKALNQAEQWRLRDLLDVWLAPPQAPPTEEELAQEFLREGILIVVQLLLPIALAHDHTLTDALRVRQKLIEPDDRHFEIVSSSRR